MKNQSPDCGLYIISPQSFELRHFSSLLEEALSTNGVDVFQLRMKDASESEIEEACKTLMPICHAKSVPFILNDYVHLAAKLGVDGVHIGIEDMPISEAKKLLNKNQTIGVSCYADGERAIDAAEEGASYVAFGAFYDTQTKTPRGRPEPSLLTWWTENSVIPCVAIGGIKSHNCAPLVKAGADFIAVVTAIWDDEQGPGHVVQEMNAAMKIPSPLERGLSPR